MDFCPKVIIGLILIWVLKDDILAHVEIFRLVIELYYIEQFWFLFEDFLLYFLHGEIFEFS